MIWEKGSPKVESLLLIGFPKEEGNLGRAASALGGNQQEVVGFVADNTTQKNVQKGQGKAHILPIRVKVFGTMKYENWQGLYDPLNKVQ